MKKKNMSRYIHVKKGLVDAVYPVLGLCTTGMFNGFYFYRKGPTTTAWTHKQWCTPCTADGTPIADTESQDTDWRKFLRDHWDTEHNHCKVEYFAEFYRIFRRAAAASLPARDTTEVRSGTGKQMKSALLQPQQKKKVRFVELSLFY